jgi:hypothetical protein
MRTPSLPGLAALAAALLTAPAAAQEGPQPRLVLSIGGGAHTGHELWTIPAQPVEIPPNTNVYDSLRLARSIGSGLLVTFAATYFPGGRRVLRRRDVRGHGMENSCSPVVPCCPTWTPDGTNEQLCNNFNVGRGQLRAARGMGWRARRRGVDEPTSRAWVRIGHGTVAAEAPNNHQPPADHRRRDPKGSPAFPSPPVTQARSGYQLRSRCATTLSRSSGSPVRRTRPVTTDTGWYHHISLTIGFDIVFTANAPAGTSVRGAAPAGGAARRYGGVLGAC